MALLTSPSGCDSCLHLSWTVAELEGRISNLYKLRDEEKLIVLRVSGIGNPSVLLVGSSLVRNARVNKCYTSCHPGASTNELDDVIPQLLHSRPSARAVVTHL